MEGRRIAALKISALPSAQAKALSHQLSFPKIPTQCDTIYAIGIPIPLAGNIMNK